MNSYRSLWPLVVFYHSQPSLMTISHHEQLSSSINPYLFTTMNPTCDHFHQASWFLTSFIHQSYPAFQTMFPSGPHTAWTKDDPITRCSWSHVGCISIARITKNGFMKRTFRLTVSTICCFSHNYLITFKTNLRKTCWWGDCDTSELYLVTVFLSYTGSWSFFDQSKELLLLVVISH